MCRNLTREQRIEGWRAFAEILSALKPRALGALAAALTARLHRAFSAPRPRRV